MRGLLREGVRFLVRIQVFAWHCVYKIAISHVLVPSMPFLSTTGLQTTLVAGVMKVVVLEMVIGTRWGKLQGI